MQKFTFFLVFSCLLGFNLNSQKLWKSLDRLPENSRYEQNVVFIPTSFAAMELDYENFSKELANSPLEFSNSRNQNIIQLPLPDGSMLDLITESSPVMEPELAAKYPSIKSFKGYSRDKQYQARFDISPYGLRASILTPEGEVYIDPLYREEKTIYLSYFIKNGTEPRDITPACGVDHFKEAELSRTELRNNRSTTVDLHKYRLAISCTGEWGKVRGTVEKALADMNTSVNRLNQIYEREFASRFVLIAENDKLIHLDGATDPFNAPTSGRDCMSQNTEVINKILVNPNKYDLGHVYTNSCTDVGGVANLASICQGNKGNGCSCFYAGLIYITVEVTSHEMGHQFSANHTFNNCNTDAARPASNGFEPGGGSTIMSYAQLCGSNSFAGGADDYYHNGSLIEIYEHLRSQSGGAYACAEKVPTTNNAPIVKFTTKPNINIPIGTYFVLDAEGVDLDGDKIKYTFEQMNSDAVECPLGQPTGVCPLFRSYPPDTFAYRLFPNRTRILADQKAVDEVLPAYTRTLDFTVTARDHNPQGGYATWEEIQIRASQTAGPFKIISPSDGSNQEAGNLIDVTWDVANTDMAPVNCKYVDIYLSKKSALHVSEPNLTLLAGRVPNTGSAKIQMPNVSGGDNRVLVKASDNIFFDISNFRFTMNKSTKPRAYVSVDKYYEKVCTPFSPEVSISSVAIEGYTGKLNYALGQLPEGITATFSKNIADVGEKITLKFDIGTKVGNGTYRIPYSITSDADMIEKVIEFDVTSTDFSSVNTLLPLNGEKNAELPTFLWNSSSNAAKYILEVSKDPTFGTLEFSKEVTDSTYRHFKTFDKKSIYFWRVKPLNGCKEGEWLDTKSFGTLTQDCKKYSATGLPINISQSGKPTITSKINVPTGVNISDVNVTNVELTHSSLSDLTTTLISPNNTRVILWEKQCLNKNVVINAFIDDQAPIAFSCNTPISGQYKPKQPLSGFNTQDATGVWTLELADGQSGGGGKLDGFELEICASVEVENPYMVKEGPLAIPHTEVGSINNNLLLAEDKNNTAEQLTYTITKLPSTGKLKISGVDATVGATFTQAQINNGALSYIYSGPSVGQNNDAFHYIVKDTEGGWLGVNVFNIVVSGTTSTKDNVNPNLINLFPNPSNGIYIVSLEGNASNFNKVSIYTTLGKLVKRQQVVGNNTQVDLTEQESGIYLFEFTNGIDRIVKKVMLSK